MDDSGASKHARIAQPLDLRVGITERRLYSGAPTSSRHSVSVALASRRALEARLAGKMPANLNASMDAGAV
jgi:hypothetical protein